MAAGTSTYEGLAAPLYPTDGFAITQTTASASTDILTINAASSGTGKFVVFNTSAGTQKFAVGSSGDLHCSNIGTLSFASAASGTASFAVSGLTSNDVVIISGAGSNSGVIAVESVAAGTLTLRNASSETAGRTINYLVIAKA